ncbi:biotin carboxylase [Undibacterium sp. GrIS 1.2]|uniref:ATP-grasp domain-containing protein n=1 Tax=Undibacterium sp. GrIS 1.2 TaxID=3143933 RepID=UPI00339847E1
MERNMLMIGGWTDIYEKTKALGFALTLVQKKGNITHRDFELADQIITSDLNNAAVPELVASLHATKPFDVVVSFQELGMLNAAVIGDRLGIASNPLAPVLLTCNKGRMREHLDVQRIRSIPYLIASSPEDVIDFAQRCGWPVILKPISGTGSKQIHKLHAAHEVAPAYAAIVKDFPNASPIAEKFINGLEVSVEGFSWHGKHTILGVTDKITTGAPHFVETGHSMPSALAPALVAQIKALTEEFLVSVGHMSGPSHTEMIISDDGPVIVESHTRTGGDRIFEMVELVHGVDMIGATLQGYAGKEAAHSSNRAGGAAIRYLTLPAGEITAIAGIEQARNSAGVVRCDIDLQIGMRTNSFKNSNERHGYILAIGDSAAEAIENVENAMKKIHIIVA